MTENDKKLLAEARQLSHFDWDKTIPMEEKAESTEAKRMIHSIGSALYHLNEAYEGMD